MNTCNILAFISKGRYIYIYIPNGQRTISGERPQAVTTLIQ